MPYLSEIKKRGLLTPDQIKQVEDDVARMVRKGLDAGIFMCINFEDWYLADPEALTGPTHTANIIVTADDVSAIKKNLEAAGERITKTEEDFAKWAERNLGKSLTANRGH
jgi:hypothetical protein